MVISDIRSGVRDFSASARAALTFSYPFSPLRKTRAACESSNFGFFTVSILSAFCNELVGERSGIVFENAPERLDRVPGQRLDLSVISDKAQDDLLTGTNIEFPANVLWKNNLSFRGRFYNGHMFYSSKKVLLYV
jgi:hypothetical protein